MIAEYLEKVPQAFASSLLLPFPLVVCPRVAFFFFLLFAFLCISGKN